MKQYERIVSYLYRYESEKKRENSGYAKIESREAECRIRVQARLAAPAGRATAYFFHQNPTGIETVEIGEMQVGRNEMNCKAKTDAENLFGSGKKFEDIDGIFIDLGTTECYATTWKNDYFYLGDWKPEKNPVKTDRSAPAIRENSLTDKDTVPEKEMVSGAAPVLKADQAPVEDEFIPVHQTEPLQGTVEEAEEEVSEEEPVESYEEEELRMAEMMPESADAVMEKRTSDFGYRILKTFPTMYPFQEMEKGTCVKMELQDIGCLPMRFWSLSGNRFLLHGYYCYRHLVFFKQGGKYYLGVPGIYSEKEKRSGLKHGFQSFRPVSDGKRQGTFGYWFLELN